MSDQQLAQELHKLIIRKFKKGKVHSTFIDNIRSTDLADMQLISKFNKGFRFLLCVIYIFSKYAWVIPLKDKKCITVTNAFQNIFVANQDKYGQLKAVNFTIEKSWLEKKCYRNVFST